MTRKNGRTLTVVSIDGRSNARDLKECSVLVRDVEVSADGAAVAACGQWPGNSQSFSHLQLWNARTLASMRKLDADGLDEKPFLEQLAISPGGAFLASLEPQDDDFLRVWTTATGAERSLHRIDPDPPSQDDRQVLEFWSYTKGGRYLAANFSAPYIRFYDAATLKLAAIFYAMDSGAEWLVSTPDGRFDGSAGAVQGSDWHDGMGVTPLAARPEKRAPGLLRDLLAQ